MLFEIAHCLWIRSFFYSNFEKQNRKGSPTSLIYPYIGKLASFLIKQFFTPKKEHQTLMRSRLRRFCSERCIAADADQNANCFYAAVCTLFSPQNFDSPFGLPQDDQVGALPSIYGMPHTADVKNSKAVFGTAVHLMPTFVKAYTKPHPVLSP